MKYPKSFDALIASLKKLPGVGYKSAERMAFQIINMDEEEVSMIAKSLIDSKQVLHKCPNCGLLTDGEICDLCSDINREKIITVVETSKEAYTFLKMESFKGYVHVLNGVINIANGIGPEQLNIDNLIKRIKELNIEEVIIATNPNVEGEATAMYLRQILSDMNIKVTRLAYGLPVGGNIDYIDEYTILKAFEGRRKI